MTFDITPHKPILRVIIWVIHPELKSNIVAPLTPTYKLKQKWS